MKDVFRESDDGKFRAPEIVRFMTYLMANEDVRASIQSKFWERFSVFSGTEQYTKRRLDKLEYEAFSGVLRETIEYHIREKKDIKILDAGCGQGKGINSILEEYDVQAVGIDLSPKFSEHDGDKFALADVRSLPFEDDTFDLIYSAFVFRYIKKDFMKGVYELFRCLKPDGTLIMNQGLPISNTQQQKLGIFVKSIARPYYYPNESTIYVYPEHRWLKIIIPKQTYQK